MNKYPIVSGMKEKTRPPLVLVTWRDAEHEFGWKDGNTNIEPINLPLVYSIGWFIYSNKHGVKICQTWTVDNHAQTLVIPKNMIEKVEEIWPEKEIVKDSTKSTAKPTMKRTKKPTLKKPRKTKQ